MKYAVFFDIDGTIWDIEQNIPQDTIDAIRALRANGHYAFLCSGRTRAFITEPNLLEIGFDGIVAGCGTYVEKDGEILRNHIIPSDLVEDTTRLLKKYGMPVVLEGNRYLHMDLDDFEGDPFRDILIEKVGSNLKPIRGTKALWSINKFSVNQVSDALEIVEPILEKEYTILRHGFEFMELVPKGFDKGVGLQYMAEQVAVDLEHTVAIGDSVNDLDMLQRAGYGIAMGNGTQEAKAAADFVTTNLEDGGIAHALRHLNLIP